MSKIILSDLVNLQNETTAVGAINSNNATIETAFDNTLSRDGTSPNTMEANLDMDSNRILNLPAAIAVSEPVTLGVFNSVITGAGNVPAGGLINQVLTKNSSTNFDTEWSDFSTEITAGTNIAVTGTSPATVSVIPAPFFTSVNYNGSSSGSTNLKASAAASGILTLPAATDTLVSRTATETLTNKTLITPVVSNQQVDNIRFNGTTSGTTNLSGPAIGTTKTLTLPDITDTLVGKATTDTFTGAKTFGAAGNVGKLIVAGTTSGTTILNATAVASGTLTLPAATDTLVGKATTDTLTNKTLTSPTITTSIMDQIQFNGSSSGNTVFKAAAAASGTMTMPAATDTFVGKATTDTFTNKTFNSTGTGNVLQVSGVTVSSGQYPGETTTGNATAGNVGEYISSSITSGSAVSLTSGVGANVTTISLAAGDWDVYFDAYFAGNAATTVAFFLSSIGTVSATPDATNGRFATVGYAPAAAVFNVGSGIMTCKSGSVRIPLSSTTTIYAVVQSVFAVSTCTAYGILQARRAR